jgi:hypothetical protein
MLIELIIATLIVAFLLVATLGHALLATAIYKCLREDYVNGRGRRAPARNTSVAGSDVGRATAPGGFIETVCATKS